VFSVWSVPKYYKHGKSLDLRQFCTESVKRRLEPGGRGIAVVVAVVRKRLVTH
jgi:hypothetical protein